jgi:hypothetical protein
MNRHRLLCLLLILGLLAPTASYAAFNDSTDRARVEVSQLSQQQLDSLNTRVFTDAFLTAKIIGYEPSEIDQLKADIQHVGRISEA